MTEVAQAGAAESPYAFDVWVENTPHGDAEVMVLNTAISERPVCHCSFHYHYGYTDNDTIHRATERMALELGAKEPVRFVAMPVC